MAPVPHLDLKFRSLASAGPARAGTFETPHGTVQTPAFIPVATRAALKGLTHDQLERIGPQVLLANTYHLHLRPGEDVVARMGGLHGFTGWARPWVTDSGGYQVFSLSDLVKVREDGVTVRSHLDGAKVELGPTQAIRIQEALGADLIMAFDHCLGLPAERGALADAVDRTTRWTEACIRARTRDDQALFGIVQGGTDAALRERSAAQLSALDLPGYAIGGLAVGEGGDLMRSTVEQTMALLPDDRPRHLMGVGPPLDLIDAIAEGVDLFDCVLPTRNGRRGFLFTRDGVLRIGARRYIEDERAVDDACCCLVCTHHSRAYLRHLFQVGDHTAVTLGSLHNVTFLVDLVARARRAILEGTFEAWRAAFTRRWSEGEAAWRREHEEDPHAARRSQAARVDQERRRDT